MLMPAAGDVLRIYVYTMCLYLFIHLCVFWGQPCALYRIVRGPRVPNTHTRSSIPMLLLLPHPPPAAAAWLRYQLPTGLLFLLPPPTSSTLFLLYFLFSSALFSLFLSYSWNPAACLHKHHHHHHHHHRFDLLVHTTLVITDAWLPITLWLFFFLFLSLSWIFL